MTKTKYYDLQMDDPQDDYDVEVVNANLKKIDEQMKIRENATNALQEPEFTVADKRENIASKEKISKILGKIAKFFADLKKVAFTGDYADLTNKPTYGKGFITDKSGSITINLDGETITLDQAKNVIKLADTLKEKINGAFPAANVVNNQITTETGYALDARQANPNIDGTLAKQVADLNGSLKMIDCGIGAFSKSDSALNVGTTMKTRVKFNKTFDRDPVVVVSWDELNANPYLDYLTIDRLTVDGEGFEAITRTKHADTWKYTWYFSWIAIAN